MTFSLGVFLTLLTSITTGFTGRYLGYRGTKFFIFTGAFATVFINTWNLFYIQSVGVSVTDLGEFFSFDLLVINWVLVFDVLTCFMIWMVSVVSASIQMFSCFYMRFDPHFIRFMSYLTLFTFFMFLFVSSGNFMYTIWGWEGIGICSYLLITFWFTRVQANKSALKALLVNKIGDIGLLLGVVLTFYFVKSLDLLSVFSLTDLILAAGEGVEVFYFYILFFGFFLAVMAKSAQFGLHIWLPDAMDGPTPVSALIHAATMVTAGIYLFIKICLILNLYKQLFIVIIFIGSLTALYCALTALVHYDIKKIIAYSTCSQLGYLFITLGLEQYTLSFLHLLAHAFYKSLLFISAGSVIYALSNEQDIRKMGGLRNLLPSTFIFFMIGAFSSMSFPFVATFYAKEIIITNGFLFSSNSFVFKTFSYFSFILMLLSVLVTVMYTARLLYLIFFGKFNGFRISLQKIGNESVLFILSACPLSIFSIYFGYYAKNSLLNSFYLFSGVLDNTQQVVEFAPTWLRVVPVVLLLLGLYLVYYIYTHHAARLMYLHMYYNEYYKVIYYSFNVNKLMVYLVRYTLNLSTSLYILFDKGALEKIIEFIWTVFVKVSSYFYFGQTKNIYATVGLMYCNIVVAFSLPIMVLFFKQSFHPEILVNRFIYFKEFFFVRETEIIVNSLSSETTGYKIGLSRRISNKIFSLVYPPIGAERYKDLLTHVSASFNPDSSLDALYGFGFTNSHYNLGLILLILATLFAGICFWGKYRSILVNLSFFFIAIWLNVLFLFSLGFEFFALILLFIYAGALVILFLFVLMTSSLDDQVDNRLTNLSFYGNKFLYLSIAVLLGLFKMLFSLDSIKFILAFTRSVDTHISYQTAANYEYSWKFFTISVYGEYLLNYYVIFLVLTSIILFIGMFGSIVITLMTAILFTVDLEIPRVNSRLVDNYLDAERTSYFFIHEIISYVELLKYFCDTRINVELHTINKTRRAVKKGLITYPLKRPYEDSSGIRSLNSLIFLSEALGSSLVLWTRWLTSIVEDFPHVDKVAVDDSENFLKRANTIDELFILDSLNSKLEKAELKKKNLVLHSKNISDMFSAIIHNLVVTKKKKRAMLLKNKRNKLFYRALEKYTLRIYYFTKLSDKMLEMSSEIRRLKDKAEKELFKLRELKKVENTLDQIIELSYCEAWEFPELRSQFKLTDPLEIKENPYSALNINIPFSLIKTATEIAASHSSMVEEQTVYLRDYFCSCFVLSSKELNNYIQVMLNSRLGEEKCLPALTVWEDNALKVGLNKIRVNSYFNRIQVKKSL